MQPHTAVYAVPVSLEQILQSREARAARQRQMLDRLGLPLVSFTMNIPGPVKDSPLIRFAFRAALGRLLDRLGAPAESLVLCQPTGCEALLAYDCPAPALKKVCLAMEEEGELGRLLDLDVLNQRGEKLSRGEERRCLICGGPVGPCSRSRAHGLPALERRTGEILYDFAARHLGELAEEALLQEVRFTPKPGLVDQWSTGAHTDMDLPLFEKSARALAPHLRRFAGLGLSHAGPEALQAAGRQAEAAMFAATEGVNTHKGAVYSLALLLSAAGECLTGGGDLFAIAAATAAALPPPQNTNGSAVRRQYGIGGVRQEAVSGFPTLGRCWKALDQEGSLAALLESMVYLEDTTLYHRGGAVGAAFVRERAGEILAAPPEEREAMAYDLDRELTRRRLSPGGSADILALSLFLQSLAPLLEPENLRLLEEDKP